MSKTTRHTRTAYPDSGLVFPVTTPGVITATPHGEDWLLISIGRAKSAKYFNIRRGEIAELVRVLTEVLAADTADTAGTP